MNLCLSRKGIFIDMNYKSGQVILQYEMPFSEIIYDFFNELKSLSRGYATLDTVLKDYQAVDLVKLEVFINYGRIDALAFIVHREDAYSIASRLVKKLKYTVPRKLYPMPAQAIVENKVIAREDIPPLRKNAAVSSEKKSISKQQAMGTVPIALKLLFNLYN